jgi:tRNA(adenine34) deaminase
MKLNMNKYMKAAYREALKAYDKNEVPIGAVVVLDDKIIARAHNLRETTQQIHHHAEFLTLTKAAKKLKTWKLDQCTLYVTLEPCYMCAGLILQARVKEVIFAVADPKLGAVISVDNLFDKNPTNKVKYSCSQNQEASELLKKFFKNLRLR